MNRVIMLLCSLLTLTLMSCGGASSGEQSSQGKDYTVVRVTDRSVSNQTATLNQWASEGWELEAIETELATLSNGTTVDLGTTAINHVLKRQGNFNGCLRWEYMVMPVAGKTIKKQNQILNERGLEGWVVAGTYTELGPVRYPGNRNLWRVQTTSIDYTLSRPKSFDANAKAEDVVPQNSGVEYKLIQIAAEKKADTQTDLLNNAAIEGWELVSSYNEVGEVGVNRRGWRAGYVGTYAVTYVLMRPLTQHSAAMPQ